MFFSFSFSLPFPLSKISKIFLKCILILHAKYFLVIKLENANKTFYKAAKIVDH